jgi:hypothetical protein
MREESEAGLDKMSMLAFSYTILLRRMRTRDTVRDTRALEVGMKTVILTAPVGLNSANLSV